MAADQPVFGPAHQQFFVSGAGAVIAISSLFLAAGVVVRHLLGFQTPLGWASTMVVSLLLGGMILLELGLIGEYLIRILDAVSKRPAFVVRQTCEGGSAASGDDAVRAFVDPGASR